MKTISYIVMSVMALTMFAAISCDMRSEEEIEISNKIVDYREIQVLTIDGDTVTIRGGATCHIYKIEN